MSVVDVISGPFCEESERSIDYLLKGSLLPLSSGEPIPIYLTLFGSVIPMRVLESESIGSVKLRIQKSQGFGVEKQKLVFGGRELARNNSLIKEYGVSSGNWLHLVVKFSDLILVTVGTCGQEFKFQVDRHRNVGHVKRRIAKKGKGFTDPEGQEELLYNGEKLEDETLIEDVCVHLDDVLHLVVQKSAKLSTSTKPSDSDVEVELSIVAENWNDECPEEEEERSRREQQEEDKNILLLEPIISNPMITLLPSTWHMFHSVLCGLANGRSPIRSSEGTGGVYIMQDASGDKYAAIFKPTDEEPMAINNPQGLPLSSNGEGLKRGTRVGEGALREVAAYLLDHPKKTGPRWSSVGEIGFSGVPPTIMVHFLHEGFNHPEGFHYSGGGNNNNSNSNVKVGSLQMFMNNYGSCEDIGPQYFPVEEVHKITVLDIRTANADRHAGNILISRDEGDRHHQGTISLIPIDHGYCLPETFEDCTFDWLYWPQARRPYSQEVVEYIKSLDAEEDIKLLQFHGWDLSVECARVLRISTMLLKKGVKIGLTPFAIGNVMCREILNKKSMIEEIVDEAEDSMLPGMSEVAFLDAVSQMMDIQLDKVMKAAAAAAASAS